MASSSVLPFVEQLFAKIQALPIITSQSVSVFIGPPGQNVADQVVAICGTGEPITNEITWAQLGNFAQWENYKIPLDVSCFVGGDSGTGSINDPISGNAQITALQNATNIFNAIRTAVLADTNFAVSNGGTPLIQFCRLGAETLQETDAMSGQTRGRTCAISCEIEVTNRISTT